jgi:hypothetical protein
MATRRVKRIKRSKKQVHRARGRKTNHRRRRHTRRQTGGAIIDVCKKTHTGFIKIESNAVGIDITYDDATQLFKIGTQPTIADLETFNGKNRYERAVWILKLIRQSNQLNWYNFALFAPLYCHEYTDPQCTEIRDFVERYRTSKIPDNNGAVEDRTIETSIQLGIKQSERQSYKPQIVAHFGKAPAVSGAAAASSAAEFDKRCVITSNQVSFLGTPFPWQDHEAPLEITTFEFARKNKGLMEFLIANVEKFVFFKTKLTTRTKTAKSLSINTIDAIFLSIHFKKNRENYCALATFKDKDAFNLVERIYGSKQQFPHFLLYPNNQPGTNDTTDQANVATCYIGNYKALPTTYNDFVKVIDQFVEYKKAGCDEDLAREFYSDDPTVLALFESLSARIASLSLTGE